MIKIVNSENKNALLRPRIYRQIGGVCITIMSGYEFIRSGLAAVKENQSLVFQNKTVIILLAWGFYRYNLEHIQSLLNNTIITFSRAVDKIILASNVRNH